RGHRERPGPSIPWSHRLDQHRTALPAADAFGGDAAPRAQPLHRIDEMQHDTIARRADGMAKADRAAIDIEFRLVDLTRGAVEIENLPAEFLVVPGGEATEHLRGEGLVQFPSLNVLQSEIVALEQLGRRQHRAKAHDRWIERRPLAVEDDGLRLQAVFG